MKKLLSTVLLLIGAALIGQAASPAKRIYYETKPLPDKEHFHIFILAGQSNMDGRGLADYEDRLIHPRVLSWNYGLGCWEPGTDPISHIRSAPNMPVHGVSLAQEFLRLYAEDHPDVMVGYVKLSEGGTDLRRNWVFEPKKGFPLNLAIGRGSGALAFGTFKGILWHQGESDLNGGLTPGYEQKLIALIGYFRTQWNAPEIPFILGELPAFKRNMSDPDAFKQMNEILRSIPAKVPFTACASAEGLIPNGDQLHISSASQKVFGARYYEAWKKLTESK